MKNIVAGPLWRILEPVVIKCRTSSTNSITIITTTATSTTDLTIWWYDSFRPLTCSRVATNGGLQWSMPRHASNRALSVVLEQPLLKLFQRLPWTTHH